MSLTLSFRIGDPNQVKEKKSTPGVVHKDNEVYGYSNSYAHAVKIGPQYQNVENENKPEIALDKTCVNQQDYSTSLMGKVNKFGSLTNLNVVLANEGFDDIKLKYMGGYWVMIEFQTEASKEKFKANVGIGKVFWVRAKEVSGWIPNIVKDDEEESDTNDEIRDEKHDECASMHNHAAVEGESDVEEVSETIFENEQYQAHKKDDLNIGQNDIRLDDPFNIYDLLYKKQDNIFGGSSSDNLKYPPGFTPTVATEVQSNAFKKSKMEGEWVPHGKKLLIISVYASQELSKNKMLWDYLNIVIDNWNGKVVIMGDFNEVHKQDERYGSIFNVQGVDAFNSFIMVAGLKEVPLRGCSFPNISSITKTSKLDPFLISEEKIRAWIKVKRDSSKNIKKTLKAELAEIDLSLDKREGNSDVLNKRMSVSKSLQELDKLESMEVAQKAKIKWAIEGDENSKRYHGILNKKEASLLSVSFFKKDVEQAVYYSFEYGTFPKRSNSSFIALIPKMHGAKMVKDFKPITLTGSLYKIIAKILANRLVVVLGDIVNEVQSAFVANRQIRDGPLILNESFHWFKKNKQETMIFKVDFEKAYDSVRWDYLHDVLKFFGFGDRWCGWIQSYLRSSRDSFIMNGSPTREFLFYRGLKQDDPRSSFFFILIMESLHISVQRVVDAGMFRGILMGLSLYLSRLFYAYGVVFMGHWSDSNIDTIVQVLECFYRASGLGRATLEAHLSYLGSKVGDLMSRVQSWNKIVNNLSPRLSNWKMKTLSIGGRLTLIKSVLGSMPIYHMSLFKVPMKVLQRMDPIRCHFFNGVEHNGKKLIWVKWSKVLYSKEKGEGSREFMVASVRSLIDECWCQSMGSHRTKEDDVAKISTSIYFTNFPETCSAKDLFNTCKQYGHVVDAFIPSKISKAGKRFGFVRFINFFNVERLVSNLCTGWIDRFKLRAYITRFQRPPVNVKNHVLKSTGGGKNYNTSANVSDNIYKNDQRPIGVGKTYMHAVKGISQHGSRENEVHALVLDDDCLLSKDLSKCLLGRVKEFASLANLKMTLNNKGFMDIKIQYMGEMWVMLEFGTKKYLKFFRDNVSVGSWFSQINQAFMDFVMKRKIAWVELEETPGWVPDFLEDAEDEDQSDVDSKDGRSKVHESGSCEESDREGVPETLFDEDGLMKNQSEEENMDKHDDMSEDPFIFIHCLKRKTSDGASMHVEEGRGGNDENGNEGNVDVDSVVPSGNQLGGSILSLLDGVVKVGQVIGYKMDGCMSNMAEIIESQGVDETCWGNMAFDYVHSDSVDYFIMVRDVWRQNGKDFLIIVVYAPHDIKEKTMLWDYLTREIGRWKGEVVVMGDFNECWLSGGVVRYFHYRFKMEGFSKIVVDAWKESPSDESNAMICMMGKLKFLKTKIREWNKTNMLCRKSVKAQCKADLEAVEVIIDSGNVWDCGTDKAPGPDGFTFRFYWYFWYLIDNDVYNAVKYFFMHGEIPKGCNSYFIALIPKNLDANLVKDFRPISLIGSLYKIIAKILANRLVGVLGDIVNEVQYAFIADRHILDGPFILDELIQWCKRKKKQFLVFKVDFEKEYDSVRWDFLDDILRKFGFGDKWCKWIQSCLRTSRRPIILNGSPTEEFQFYKRLKQGDPLSPFLFILIMECLHLSFQRVEDARMFKGIKASGLRINMSKSKLMGLHVDSDKVKGAAIKLGCLTFKTPFMYLGSTVGGSMSRIQDWEEVAERVKSRLSKWKMKTLSIGGRLTLLKSVLRSMSMFHMSIFKVPLGVLRKLDSIRSHFFNGHDPNCNKASWVNWKMVLAHKDKGGLDVSNLFDLNRGLMFKWIWRFYTQDTSLRVRVIKAIYGETGNMDAKVKAGSTSCWISIVHEAKSLVSNGIDLFKFMRFKLGNGENAHFWKDRWIEGNTLKKRFPRLYALELCKEIIVAMKVTQPCLAFSFRRSSRGGVEQE
uniref:RNA-directed DNA polymerase, eukaryota, reverse transcriptase zinc-binding domain protein n=1 Tax=Tanacetum cinerariifolium TaxID=118510 RepID=A0A6L2P2I0_TANCI|nr:RNA-directed DNA polymerase, eukaryota, reverse transcriptase zinc-binding domain protein [Tanacetum cinerariifolium]